MRSFLYFIGSRFLSGEKGEKGDKGDQGEPGGIIPLSQIVDTLYPVGCYFETTDTTFDPNTTWTGTTWVLEDEGLVHVSSGTNYTVSANAQDGGEATHLLTGDESGIQAHNTVNGGGITGGITGGSHAHTAKGWAKVTDGSGSYVTLGGAGSSTTYSVNQSTSHTHDLPSHTHSISAANAKVSHNNMQPYKIVNRWHRTA